MKTLLSFGDSHTAGAEIDAAWSSECKEKAYPQKIADHYGMRSENHATCGCGNSWILKSFIERIKYALSEKEDVVVHIGFTEPSRHYIIGARDIVHGTTSLLKPDIDERAVVNTKLLKLYELWLRSHTDIQLHEMTVDIIWQIQSICKLYNIPYIFTSNIGSFKTDISLIDGRNFYGLHDGLKIENEGDEFIFYRDFSFYGVATHDPLWKDYQYDERWCRHMPEKYHEFWANKLIKFIDEQQILDTTS